MKRRSIFASLIFAPLAKLLGREQKPINRWVHFSRATLEQMKRRQIQANLDGSRPFGEPNRAVFVPSFRRYEFRNGNWVEVASFEVTAMPKHFEQLANNLNSLESDVWPYDGPMLPFDPKHPEQYRGEVTWVNVNHG